MIVVYIWKVLEALVDIYCILIFVRCLLTWLPGNTNVMSSVNNVLGKICDPYLNLFRKFIPPIGGTIDISPIIALLVLQFAVTIIYRIILML